MCLILIRNFNCELIGGSLSSVMIEFIEDFYVYQQKAAVVNIMFSVASHGLWFKDIWRHFGNDITFQLEDFNDVTPAATIRSNNILIMDYVLQAKYFHKLLSPAVFNFQGYFLIILTQEVATNSAIKTMMEMLWKKFILNVNVLVRMDYNNTEAWILLTYFPFNKDSCGQINPVILNTFQSGKFQIQNTTFYPRKDTHLHNCTLKVGVFHAPPYMFLKTKMIDNRNVSVGIDGMDGQLLMTIAKYVNFTYELVVVPESIRWGEIYRNGTATGAFKLVTYLSVFNLIKVEQFSFFFTYRFSTTLLTFHWECFQNQHDALVSCHVVTRMLLQPLSWLCHPVNLFHHSPNCLVLLRYLFGMCCLI